MAPLNPDLVFDHLPVIVFRFDRAGTIFALEGDGLRRVGLPRELLTDGESLTVSSMFENTEPPEVFQAAVERAFLGDPVDLQFRWRGEYLDGRLIPTPAEGKVEYVNGALALIPQSATRESDDSLGNLLNHLAGMAYRCKNDEAWTMEVVSAGCLSVTGYSAEELRNNQTVAFGDLVHPDDAGWLWEKCQVNLDSGRFCSNQYRIRHANGEIRWVWDRAQGVYDDAGTLEFIEGLVTDITTQKNEEATREALRDQLEHSQKMNVVGQLAGGIAHDFNNLLFVISANLDLAADGAPSWREHVDHAREAASRAAELTKQLLTFSRRTPSNALPMALNAFVEEQATFFDRLFPPSVALIVDTDDADPRVRADRTQLSQVVSNLLLNARDAMPDGGDLSVVTGTRVFDEPFVETNPWAKPGAFALIEVTDTGVGMSDETVRRIFEPFFTTKPLGKGTGLGLALTHGIVEQHGGIARVVSAIDQGTSVQIYLPLIGDPATIREDTMDLQQSHGATGTILVVEDQPEVRRVVTQILKRFGYEVLTADNGVEGVRVVEELGAGIDLVLMDALMPEMSGPEAYDRIRELCPDLPVLFTSGFGVDQDPGLVGKPLLQKPYSVDELLQRVREHMRSDVV